MEYTYLVGEGPEYKELYDEVMEEYEESKQLFDAFQQSLEGGLRAFVGRRNGKVVSIGTTEKLSVEQHRALGLRSSHGQSEGHHLHYPARNTRKGKELSAQIEELNKTQFLPKNLFIERLGIDCMKFNGRHLYYTSVGFDENKIYIRIPAVKGDKEYPENVASWLREPQGDEYKVFMR